MRAAGFMQWIENGLRLRSHVYKYIFMYICLQIFREYITVKSTLWGESSTKRQLRT